MMKKVEFNNMVVLIQSLSKENMISFFKMMSLEWPSLAQIKTDGFMWPKLSNKRPKVTSLKVKEKLIFNMILDKHTKELKMQKYLFGIKRKDKYSKYKLQKI